MRTDAIVLGVCVGLWGLGSVLVSGAQHVPGSDPYTEYVVDDGLSFVEPPGDWAAFSAKADAIVVVRFRASNTDVVDVPLEGAAGFRRAVETTLMCQVIESLKVDTRLPERRGILHIITGLGGEYPRSSRQVSRVAPEIERFRQGREYLLYLEWWPAREGFLLMHGPAVAFELGDKDVTPIVPNTVLGRRVSGRPTDEILELARRAAMSAPK
jgi:hypothetical protein